jgi:hypothetical protein
MAKKQTIEAPKTLRIKILLPVAGKFSLSCNVGEEYDINTNTAKELIDAAYAELVK